MMNELMTAIDEAGYTHLVVNDTTVQLNASDPYGTPPAAADQADIATVTIKDDRIIYEDDQSEVVFLSVAEWSRFFADLMNDGWQNLSLDDYTIERR